MANMCGRFAQKNDEKTVEREFGVQIEETDDFGTSYNIAPTQLVGAVRASEEMREYARLKWGLIPSWAKDASFAAKLINARAETLSEKASFREAYKKRRCLIPASGFYEWEKTAGGKQPHYFYLKNKDIFGFGGLWEEWLERETGELVETLTIITTEANAVLKPIHERMPLIIAAEDYEQWLDPSERDVSGLLKPFAAEAMDEHRVGKAVNSPSNDSPELIAENR
jgi:putative SOS response-associated peptidase YedK